MEISDEVRQAAQDALDRYLPSHQRWTRGRFTAAYRRVCGYQAIWQLECPAPVKGMLFMAVTEVIIEQYPKIAETALEATAEDRTEAVITSFNDHWSIRYADVRRVFEKVTAG